MKTYKQFITEAAGIDHVAMTTHLRQLHDTIKDTFDRAAHEEQHGASDLHRNLAAGRRMASENHLNDVRHLMDRHGITHTS